MNSNVDPDDPRPPIKQRLEEPVEDWIDEECEWCDRGNEAVNSIQGRPCCSNCWDGYMDYLSGPGDY